MFAALLLSASLAFAAPITTNGGLLDAAHQSTVDAIRSTFPAWQGQIAQISPKGQKEVYEEMSEAVAKLAKAEKTPYTPTNNQGIVNALIPLTWDTNIAKVPNHELHDIAQEFQEVNEEIAKQLRKHHARGGLPGFFHHEQPKLPLDAAHQSQVNALRSAAPAWQTQINALDAEGQKDAYEALDKWIKKTSKYEGVAYVKKPAAAMWDAVWPLTWDTNFAKISHRHLKKVQNLSNEVQKVIDHHSKHLHRRALVGAESNGDPTYEQMVAEIQQLDDNLNLSPEDEKEVRKQLVKAIKALGYENTGDWQDKSDKDILLKVLADSTQVFDMDSSHRQGNVMKQLEKTDKEYQKLQTEYSKTSTK